MIPWSEGESDDLHTGRSDIAAAAYIGVGGQLAAVVSSWLALRLEIRAGLVLPELAVRFGDEQVARFGRPLGEALLGLEIRIH